MIEADGPMSYLMIEWRHDHPDEPTTLYSELDEERREVRKVEVYADGGMDLADAGRQTGSTRLGEGVTPTVEEINSFGSFTARVISKDDFDRVWAEACSRHSSGAEGYE